MLVSYATHNYIHQLQLLLTSYRETNPGATARIYLCDWPPAYVKVWRKKFPEFELIDKRLPPSIYDTLTRRGKFGSILRLKPSLLLETYLATDEPLIWIDADTLVTKPVAPLLARVAEAGDLGVTHRRRSSEYMRFAVGVLVTVRTERGLGALQAYNDETQKNEGLNDWFYDQIGMARFSDNYDYKLVPLTDLEHSLRGDHAAMIISARTNVNIAKVAKEVFPHE